VIGKGALFSRLYLFQFSYRTFNVLDDQELREGIKEYSSWPTIPQVYLKGDFLGGCDIMLSSMYLYLQSTETWKGDTYLHFLHTVHQSGELEEMFLGAGVVPKPEPEAEKA